MTNHGLIEDDTRDRDVEKQRLGRSENFVERTGLG